MTADYHARPVTADAEQAALPQATDTSELGQCDRCDEWIREQHCTHGRSLCEGHLHECDDCQVEWAESLAYDADRDEGL